MSTPSVTPHLELYIRGPISFENAASGASASQWDFNLNMAILDAAIYALQQGGGGGGTSVQVNGSTVANPNFNATTPAAPANNTNVAWQVSGSNVSAYVPNAFSNPMTTLGDIIYENATPAAARLAGNTSTAKQFLTQTGTGSASAAPAWGALQVGDIPDLSSLYDPLGTAANYLTGVTALPDALSITDSLGNQVSSSAGEMQLLPNGGGGLSVGSFNAILAGGTGSLTISSGTYTLSATAFLVPAGASTGTGGKIVYATSPTFGGTPVVGIPGSTTGSIALASATASGKYTITAPANSATPTLTLPTTSNVLAGQFAGDGVIFTATLHGASAAGTLTPVLLTQSASAVLIGPTSGTATPTFRVLQAADIPSLSGVYLPLAGGTMSGTINMNENEIVWENASLGIDTSISRIISGVIGIGTGANGSSNGTLVAGVLDTAFLNVTSASTFLGDSTTTVGTATPGTSAVTAGYELLQNTTPTVAGASTTVALSTGVAPVSLGGNSWRYTLAATETGAASNGWAGASVTLSGYTGGATGNNVTAIIVASTATTITITNPTGTATNTGAPVLISSAVVNSPILQLAGTVNTGTAGTLNSVADVWSIQNVIGSVVPNPTSYLTFTHAGSSGAAGVQVPAGTAAAPGLSLGAAGVGIANVSSNLQLCTGTAVISLISIGASFGQLTQSTNFFQIKASASATGVELIGNISSTAANCIAFGNANNLTSTSGAVIGCDIGGYSGDPFTFNPASGSATFVACNIGATIEGTSSGATTCLVVNPTITTTNLTGTNLIAAFQSAGANEITIDYSGNIQCAGAVVAGSTTVSSPSAGFFYSGSSKGITQTAEAVGTLATTGGIVTTFTAVSDERLKIAHAYKGGLDEVLALVPIKYRWNKKGQELSGQGGKKSYIGFSAQNVRKHIPEAVWKSQRHEFLCFEDRPVIAALVNAIKELKAEIDGLKARK